MRKDLRIDQSYEDLEDQSEPDGKFFFESIIQLKESNWPTTELFVNIHSLKLDAILLGISKLGCALFVCFGRGLSSIQLKW